MTQKKSFEQITAELFIFFLPFRMPAFLERIFGPFGAAASSFSFVFHIIGLVLLLASTYKSFKLNGVVFKLFCIMVGCFGLITLIMTNYVYVCYGNFHGNSPYIAGAKAFLAFVQYALIFLYCKRVFEVLESNNILRCMHISILCVLAIGYLEVLICVGVHGLKPAYDILARILNFSTVSVEEQISLTLYEPSHAAILLGAYVVPFYLAQFLKNKKIKLSLLCELVLWMIPLVFTKSTTSYLVVASGIGVALLIFMFTRKMNKVLRVLASAVIVGGIMLIANPAIIDRVTGINFSYLLKDKLFDVSNQSTATRKAVLDVNVNIFRRFPIIGCGNGLQGYFYKEALPDWIYAVSVDKGLRDVISGEVYEIYNAGCFFPGILSGYGILGIALFASFIALGLRELIKKKDRNGTFFFFYIIAFVPLMLSGMKSDFIGVYYVWFVFSIPMLL